MLLGPPTFLYGGRREVEEPCFVKKTKTSRLNRLFFTHILKSRQEKNHVYDKANVVLLYVRRNK